MCIGAVAAAHGVRGAFRVAPFTADPDAIAAYGPVYTADGERLFELEILSRNTKGVVVRTNAIQDRNMAEALRGTKLHVPRSVLPPPDEDEFYVEDLIGLRVVDETGEVVGTVRSVEDFGAGDIIDIERAGSAGLLLPFTRDVVPSIDLGQGVLVVRQPEEMVAKERAG